MICGTCSKSEFLVVAKNADDGKIWTMIKSIADIYNTIDMWDVVGECYEYYKVFVWKEEIMNFEELEIRGTWHDLNDPLHISIVGKDGEIYFDGRGTDH